MDSVVLCVLADISGLVCNDDPLMLATLSRVCKVFNERIGSCNALLESLATNGYFVDINIKELFVTYGKPTQRLCKIYCVGLHDVFDLYANRVLFKEEYRTLFAVLTAHHSQRANLVKLFEWYEMAAVYELCSELNRLCCLSTFGVDYREITKLIRDHHRFYLNMFRMGI